MGVSELWWRMHDTEAERELALRMAERHALTEIERCPMVELPDSDAPGALHRRWRNVYPLIDMRINAPEAVSLGLDVIRWAKARGLVDKHPDRLHPWALRVRPGAAAPAGPAGPAASASAAGHPA